MRVTLKDIAARVGVDKSAVSLALSDRTAGKLSPERVKEIRRVAAEIGYRPNLSASYLARGSTQCVGVVLSYLDQYPFNHYFHLINEACTKAGYHAVPLPVQRRWLNDPSRTSDLGRVHVDGMIVLDYMTEDASADLQTQLPGHPLVCRMADKTMVRPNCPSIVVDYYEGTRELLRHVVRRGWHKLKFIAEDDPTRPHMRNGGKPLPRHVERAIEDTSAELGVPMPFEGQMILTPERGAKARYDIMLAYLQQNRLEPGVCLVLDGADGISGTYAALIKMGYSIGKDVAVAAMGSIPAYEHVEPLVTMVWERFEEISRLLVELAIDRIEGRRKYSSNAQFNYATCLSVTDSVPERTLPA